MSGQVTGQKKLKKKKIGLDSVWLQPKQCRYEGTRDKRTAIMPSGHCPHIGVKQKVTKGRHAKAKNVVKEKTRRGQREREREREREMRGEDAMKIKKF